MCRSGQYNHSTVEYEVSERDSKGTVKFSSTQEGKEYGIVAIVKRTNSEPTKDLQEQRLQQLKAQDVQCGKDASSSQSSSKDALSPRTLNFDHFNAQDISIALATFPEFFSQGFGINQNTSARPEQHRISARNSSPRIQNMQNECAGLVLWYIREYGL